MSTQLYNGPSLSDVLSRVETEHGTDAKIVAARKSRRGGVGGFFSRDWYEVTIDIPERRAVIDANRESALIDMGDNKAGMSLLDFAESVNAKESTFDVEVVGGKLRSTLKEMRGEDIAPNGNKSAQEGLKAAQDFAQELKKLRQQNDEEATASTEVAEIAPVETVEVVEEAEESEPEVEEKEIETEELAEDEIANEETEVVEETPSPVQAIVKKKSASALCQQLERRGVPRALLSDIVSTKNISAQLGDIFNEIPSISDSDIVSSHVVAIVGSLDEANKMARTLIGRLNTSAENISFASRDTMYESESRVIRTAEDAKAVRRSWQRRDRSTVVIIPVEDNSYDTLWAEEILTAIEPEFTLLLVDARKKVEDIENTVETLSGVDAIALVNLQATTSPAVAMQLGIPIAYVDDRVATPSMWTAILTEGLTQ
jgi:hypothetical protein